MPDFRYIRNSSALLSHGHVALRRDALSILDRMLREVDPYYACLRTVRLDGDSLIVGDLKLDLAATTRVWFFGAGKASLHVARAIEDQLGDRLNGGLVVCKEGQKSALQRIEVLHATHPVPSGASVIAARQMLTYAALPAPGDIVLCSITGGSSALLTLPCSGLELDDVQRLTKILLTCGANIFEINAVRKHISDVGGGRLAQKFRSGVRLINLTVSDVIGDALDCITDPTVPDTSTVADARATFDRFDLWNRVPDAVSKFLRPGGNAPETPKSLPWPHDHNFVLLSASSPVDASRRAAEAMGYRTLILSSFFEGEGQALGETFAAIAREIAFHGRPLTAPCALIGGGETIVKMNEFRGQGGPNQEFALACALQLPAQRPVVVIGADTDGTDGPTDVAGAVCDLSTLTRAKDRGVELRSALNEHNVTPILLELEDAVITGATGTNVNDVKLAIIA